MCHLETSPLIAAFYIETLIRFRAVKDSLVTSNLLRHMIQRFYDVKTKMFSLLVLCNGNILDVTDETKIMDAMYV